MVFFALLQTYSIQHFPYERKTLYQFLVFCWYDQVLVGLVFCYRSAKCHIVFVKSKMLNENLVKFLVDTKYDIFTWWKVFSDFLLWMINPSFHWWPNFLSYCGKHKLSQSFFNQDCNSLGHCFDGILRWLTLLLPLLKFFPLKRFTFDISLILHGETATLVSIFLEKWVWLQNKFELVETSLYVSEYQI